MCLKCQRADWKRVKDHEYGFLSHCKICKTLVKTKEKFDENDINHTAVICVYIWCLKSIFRKQLREVCLTTGTVSNSANGANSLPFAILVS